MADHYRNHRCLIEKNVPKAFILPHRLQDGDERLGIETTSFRLLLGFLKGFQNCMSQKLTKKIGSLEWA